MKDLKKANKGEQKITKGIHYQAAVCIVQDDPNYQKLSKNAKAKAKTKKCRTLAEAFTKAIRNGRLFNAFSNAGNRLQLGEALYDKANSLYDEYLADPESQAKLEALEKVELEMTQRLDYTTAGGDTKVLKELDHHNDLDQDFGIYLFDVCRRGGELQCGVYMPSDFWWQDGEMWSFKCKICPEKIKLKQPKMYQTIKKVMGDTPEEQWSICTPCCGSKFIPWARGASKVVELRVGNAIHAILAERLPEELDDEIKKVQYEWHRACGRTTAEQIAEAIPCCLPKSNLCTHSRVPGIARFNFKQWKTDGCPTLLKAGWIALCKLIATNAEVNLSRIISLCDDMSIDACENPELKTAMEMSRGINATRLVKGSSSAPKL